MLRFYYNPFYKYTNRTIIDVTGDDNFTEHDYENIDSPDTINGHIIYTLSSDEQVPTYIVDTTLSKKWFVSGITQLRTGKFQLSLLRDIISEAPLLWKGEQAYINAGTAPDGDYCKYKKWDLPFTNTKVGSQRLGINGKSSFFVFYVNQQHINSNNITEDDFKIGYTTLPGLSSYDIDVNNLNEIPYFEYVNGGTVKYWNNIKSTLRIAFRNGETKYKTYEWTVEPAVPYVFPGVNWTEVQDTEMSEEYCLRTNIYNQQALHDKNNRENYTITRAQQAFAETYARSLGPVVSVDSTNQLDAYVGKIIRVPNALDPSKYDFYRINCEKVVRAHQDFVPKGSCTLKATLENYANTFSLLTPPNTLTIEELGPSYFIFKGTETQLTYTLESLGTATTFDFTFKANTIKLPKSAVRCVNIVSDQDVDDNTIAQCLMMAQANPGVDSVEGSDANIGRIIDIQYLPFSIATQKNADFVIGGTTAVAESITTDDFSFTTTLPSLTSINKETDSIVIVSPTRKSQFKYSPYNNDGRMVFNTKITIRPNQSVIYIRPSTQGLLLQDWDDKECLIIQEDFSLTTINSAWTNYVYNNRNYQNAFNLQIQTKEFERTWERRIEQEQAKSDEWTARNISAQKAQAYTGNLPIISGIAGAIGTAWADDQYLKMAQLDREYNEALYQKSVEVARTQFTYQIDNVKSQPLIPNTITAIDCKMLDGVYLEFYSTNMTELNSIQKFYFYNGNRIDNYGTFSAYWGGFVRGKIIISESYTQPEVDELNRRLELGIFTGE